MEMKKRWNRVNLLRVRKWARYARFSGVVVIVVAFGFAGCAAVDHVEKMIQCDQRSMSQRQGQCNEQLQERE